MNIRKRPQNRRRVWLLSLMLISANMQDARALSLDDFLPTQVLDILNFAQNNWKWFQSLTTLEGLKREIFGSADLTQMGQKMVQNLANLGLKKTGFNPYTWMNEWDKQIADIKSTISEQRSNIVNLSWLDRSDPEQQIISVSPKLIAKQDMATGEMAQTLEAIGTSEVGIVEEQMQSSKRQEKAGTAFVDQKERFIGKYDPVSGVQLSKGKTELLTESAKNATSTRELNQIIVGALADQIDQNAVNASALVTQLGEIAKGQSLLTDQLAVMVQDIHKENLSKARKALDEVSTLKENADRKGQEVRESIGAVGNSVSSMFDTASLPNEPLW